MSLPSARARPAPGSRVARARFQLVQARPIGVGEDRGRAIGQDDVGHPADGPGADRGGPSGRIALGREVGQEGPISQRLESHRHHALPRIRYDRVARGMSRTTSDGYNQDGRSSVYPGPEAGVIMICGGNDPGGLAAGLSENRRTSPPAAADRVTLRDGSVVLGLVTSVSSGPRGAVEMLVRREWAETHLKTWAPSGTAPSRPAREQRPVTGASGCGLAAGAGGPPRADDRILAWIDQELKRLDDPARLARTPLMPVHLSRSDVRSLARQPQASTAPAPAWLALRVEGRRDDAAGRPEGRPRGPGIRD